jgi:hypothetical protein
MEKMGQIGNARAVALFLVSFSTAYSFGWWLVLVCYERKVLLADCWSLICSERKVLLTGG